MATRLHFAMDQMDPNKYLEIVSMDRQKAVHEAMAGGDTDIQRFYSGRVVFITGGSGFLGKQLIEKLLRNCKISKVYMLLRSKKGKNIKQRLDELTKESVYDAVREQQPYFTDKIIPVQGDVSEERLGINGEDWETLTNKVDAIFHVAATTKFDETLRVATITNIRGTRECMRLGRACKKLSTYVHVSTAFSHCTTKLIGRQIEEKFYKSPIPPETLISMAENMEDERLAGITADLIKDWPNTYTFTKALSEELIRTTSDGLPICIVRPGIVTSSMSEPSSGWIDVSALYSASGLVAGMGLGLIQTVLADVKKSLALIPCDYVNNVVIAAGRETAVVSQTKGGIDTKIYAVTPTCRNPITWGDCGNQLRKNRFKIPSPFAIYYNDVKETNNDKLFLILTLILQMVPALVADLVFTLLRKQRKFLKLTRKVYNMNSALSFFLINEWRMLDNNTSTLYENLSQNDKIIFNFDVTDIKSEDFIITWWLGIRKYLIKDGLKDTEYAIKKQKFFKILYIFINILYACLLITTIACVLFTARGFARTLFECFFKT